MLFDRLEDMLFGSRIVLEGRVENVFLGVGVRLKRDHELREKIFSGARRAFGGHLDTIE